MVFLDLFDQQCRLDFGYESRCTFGSLLFGCGFSAPCYTRLRIVAA
jgi:predicted metal-binding transcription factor (methanogenesis marker protein 9)